MRKKSIYLFLALIICLLVAVPIMAAVGGKRAKADTDGGMTEVTLWQIDGFEGGKGSRATFLKNIAEKCFGNEKTYITVVQITADAARENMELGNIPEMISYSAGFYGLENRINSRDFAYKSWCNGAYLLLTCDENADFSDVSGQNTVINEGKDNLTDIAALFCGVSGGAKVQPSGAYLNLINGKYKYLLGTQRDAYRLRTRGVDFKVKTVTQFNDLYQNVSILTKDGKKYDVCQRFIKYLCEKADVGRLGLFGNNSKLEMEELKEAANAQFDLKLNYPCGKDFLDGLKAAAKDGDGNKIKILLK